MVHMCLVASTVLNIALHKLVRHADCHMCAVRTALLACNVMQQGQQLLLLACVVSNVS